MTKSIRWTRPGWLALALVFALTAVISAMQASAYCYTYTPSSMQFDSGYIYCGGSGGGCTECGGGGTYCIRDHEGGITACLDYQM